MRLRSIFYFFIFISSLSHIYADSKAPTQAPVGWHGNCDLEKGYECGTDHTVSHSGKGSGFVRSTKDADGLGTYTQSIAADKYRGKKVQLSAYLKTQDVKDWAGMWMRIDGEKKTGLSFDNMSDRPLIGNTDWTKYEIVL